jgi:hypothetical protein
MKMRGRGVSWLEWAMFTIALLLLAESPLAGQSPLERTAGITVEGQPIEAALRRLQRSAGVALVYSPDLLPSAMRVTCACENVTVETALERILEGTDLTFRAGRTNISIVPRRTGGDPGPPGVLQGRVEDLSSGAPVVNAMIRLDNGQGVLSNGAGHFMVRNVPPGRYRVEVTSIGWQPGVDSVQVMPGDTTRIVLRIGRKAVALPEILVAPGTFSLLEDVSPGTVRALTREEIQMMPQVGEDIFRAVKRLPGVSSDDISTKLHIRGGHDREVMVRLDGLELYEPYHLQDWNGALGIIDLNAVGGVQLAAGGFGVEHGDKQVGVLDMTSRSETGPAKTTLGFSVSNITAMGRGGFAEGEGSWLVSARRGFMDWVMAMVGEGGRFSPQYYDVFGKVSRQLGRHHLLSVHVLHAGDDFVLTEIQDEAMEEVDLSTAWQSSYLWAKWRASVGRASAVTSVSTGRVTRERIGFVENLNDSPNLIDVEDNRGITFTGLRHDLGVEVSPSFMLKLGGELKRLRGDYAYANFTRHNVRLPDDGIGEGWGSTRVDLEPEGHELGAWVAARVRPVESLTAEVGVRYDEVSYTGDEDMAPRVLIAFDASERTVFRASWGKYFQSQSLHELQVGDGETEFYPSEHANQFAVGVEHAFRGGIRLRAEFYDRRMHDPHPVYINLEQELQVFPEATEDRFRFEADRGRARGFELLLERRSGRHWAWSASYVLARAEDEVGGLWTPRRYDQRHTLGLHVTYRPTSEWNLTAGWRYHTGWPATSWTWDVTPLRTGANWWDREFGEVRAQRLPAYHRLDLRLTRDFQVHGNQLHAFLDLFNVYNRTNLGSFNYDGNYVDNQLLVTELNGQEMLPFLPTFGLRYEF